MVKSFKTSEETTECAFLRRTEHLLKLNGLETAELIHEVRTQNSRFHIRQSDGFQVHLDLWKKQGSIKDSPYGELSVRVKFNGTDLTVEVMNARNLKAMDSNGSCDSFVRIHLLPEDKFSGVVKPKTQTHNRNLFPLYDETFVM